MKHEALDMKPHTHDPNFKSGFVVLAGRSNVGKSTLLNALIGTKLSITTPKPQTTRFPIHGVLHDPRGQIVFVDTPGIFEHPHDPITAAVNARARDALQGVDLILHVVDPTREIGTEERRIQTLIKNVPAPKILVINKIDERTSFIEDFRALAPEYAASIEIAALRHKNLKGLVELVFEYLPEGVPHYPEFQITNIANKLWFEELIREKVFLQTHAEVPYSTTVEIEEMEERENGLLYIRAKILTTQERHKKMLIGAGARRIKEIGQAARRELEGVTGKKIFLELEVMVDPHWPKRLGM